MANIFGLDKLGRVFELICGIYTVALGFYPSSYGLMVFAGVLMTIFSIVAFIRPSLKTAFKPGILGVGVALVILYGYVLSLVIGSTIFMNKIFLLSILAVGLVLSFFSVFYEIFT